MQGGTNGNKEKSSKEEGSKEEGSKEEGSKEENGKEEISITICFFSCMTSWFFGSVPSTQDHEVFLSCAWYHSIKRHAQREGCVTM
jgi:hypothetical protein